MDLVNADSGQADVEVSTLIAFIVQLYMCARVWTSESGSGCLLHSLIEFLCSEPQQLAIDNIPREYMKTSYEYRLMSFLAHLLGCGVRTWCHLWHSSRSTWAHLKDT